MPKVLDNVQYGFAACRIGMRKCWQWLSCYRPVILIKDQYRVLCLGSKGSGKTTALASLVGEPLSHVEPTTGFNIKTLPLKDTVIDIKELGGSDCVREYWDRYFEGQHGLLYVVDCSAEHDSLQESVCILRDVLTSGRLRKVPCVVLATHTDQQGARSKQEMSQLLGGAMHDRQWEVHMCGYQDRDGVQLGLENLVDLMTGVS